jgi:chemotaxis protein methyltransferase CheR
MSSEIETVDFDYVRKLVRDASGVALDDAKRYLVESRLGPIMRSHELPSLGHLVRQLRRRPREPLVTEVIEAMLTGETAFFRDVHPFDTLRDQILPELLREPRMRPLHIWCAASSWGQEPYTIAMILAEHFPRLLAGQVRVVATDLSGKALDRSKEGLYSAMEVSRGLPQKLQDKYFRPKDGRFQVVDKLRDMIDFRPLNLLTDPPPMGVMDIVLIRNVLVYFDGPSRERILRKISTMMANGGYLILGSSEAGVADPNLEQVRFGRTLCYRRRFAFNGL